MQEMFNLHRIIYVLKICNFLTFNPPLPALTHGSRSSCCLLRTKILENIAWLLFPSPPRNNRAILERWSSDRHKMVSPQSVFGDMYIEKGGALNCSG